MQAKVIEDSIFKGVRLTSLKLKFPRFILPEILNHRSQSRNSASSRAIPTNRMIKEMLNSTPITFKKNCPGMFSLEELDKEIQEKCKYIWNEAQQDAIKHVEKLIELGVSKETVNRLLEPFSWTTMIMTSDERAWKYLLELRKNYDVQPEFQYLAKLIENALNCSKPVERCYHLPFITDEEKSNINPNVIGDMMTYFKQSTARCARVSYSSDFNDKRFEPSSLEDDLKLFKKLSESNPPHLSPLEHPSMVDLRENINRGNFPYPWLQFRKLFENNKSI